MNLDDRSTIGDDLKMTVSDPGDEDRFRFEAMLAMNLTYRLETKRELFITELSPPNLSLIKHADCLDSQQSDHSRCLPSH